METAASYQDSFGGSSLIGDEKEPESFGDLGSWAWASRSDHRSLCLCHTLLRAQLEEVMHNGGVQLFGVVTNRNEFGSPQSRTEKTFKNCGAWAREMG